MLWPITIGSSAGDPAGVTTADLAAEYGGSASDYYISSDGSEYRRRLLLDLASIGSVSGPFDYTSDPATTWTAHNGDVGIDMDAFQNFAPTTHGITANGHEVADTSSAFSVLRWLFTQIDSAVDLDTDDIVICAHGTITSWGNANASTYVQLLALDGGDFIGVQLCRTGAAQVQWKGTRSGTLTSSWRTVGSLPTTWQAEIHLRQGSVRVAAAEGAGLPNPGDLAVIGHLAETHEFNVLSNSTTYLRSDHSSAGGTHQAATAAISVWTRRKTT